MAGLVSFMAENNIKACVFSGTGSCEMAELGHYNSHIKDYRVKPYFDEMEVSSFSGNGAMENDKPVVQGYGIFARNDFTVLSGHVSKLSVINCEVFLIKLDGEMKREHNSELNLELLV